MLSHGGNTAGTHGAAQLQPYRAIFQAEMEKSVSFLVASGYFCHPPDIDRVRDPHPGTLWGHGREGIAAESHGQKTRKASVCQPLNPTPQPSLQFSLETASPVLSIAIAG